MNGKEIEKKIQPVNQNRNAVFNIKIIDRLVLKALLVTFVRDEKQQRFEVVTAEARGFWFLY
jgi:hypothetical protein